MGEEVTAAYSARYIYRYTETDLVVLNQIMIPHDSLLKIVRLNE